jgi:putative hydrolase of the HAD superfamily
VPKAVIFDLGGVIIELGPVSDVVGTGGHDRDEFWSRWLRSEAVRQFEGGFCDADQFGKRLVAEFDLPFSPSELVDRFRAWPKGLFAGAEELLEELGQCGEVVVAALSNSNPVHWFEQQDAQLIRSLFDRPFLSFELNLVKPDRSIFDAVTHALAVQPDEIIYFDDNQLNVDAARAAGWRAQVADGPAVCRAHLADLGLVSSDTQA